MAKVVGNQIQLNNGKLVAAKTGDWQDGQHVWQDPSGNWTLSAPGVENQYSNSATAGKAVSAEVNAASAASQGVSVQNFNDYLKNLSVTNIQPTTSVPYTTNANSSYVGGLNDEVVKARTSLDQNLATQRMETAVKLDEAKAKESAALTEVQKLTTPFRADLEATKNAELKTGEVLASQKSLLDELDTLLTEGNALIKQQKEVTGLAAIRNPRIQKTMDDIAARAGVINAVVSLQNTYLANAYTSIDRSVKAITDDRQDQLNYYSTILNLANRDIVSLTAEDRALAAEQTKVLETDLANAETSSKYIKDLMVNPATALAMAQSGVTLNDSVEVINQKMANYQYAQEVKDASNVFTAAGGVLVTNPSSVPATQLKSFTDSKGNTYYYKMPKTASTASVNSAEDWLKDNIVTTDTKTTDSTKTTTSTPATETAPQFSPSGGKGTIYVNPTTGSIWQYISSGWSKIS